ncbi:MAG: pilus assembly protein [Gammaproteobacteria bacterium]
MNIRKQLQTSMIICLFVFLTGISQLVHAVPINYPNKPLFLGSSTTPNIFFAVDDSGSMGWDEILNAGTWAPGAAITGRFAFWITHFGCCGKAWDREFRRLSCRGYNVMAFDPNVTYTPWDGVDANGVPFQNQTLKNARFNPYFTNTVDIRNHLYFPWNDADNDGLFDGPFGFRAPADPATDECGDVSSNAGAVFVNTLTPAQQTNYANWYTYFRRRDFVLKRAVSALITGSSSNMGLATLHNNNNVGIPVKDISNAANKSALLSKLFQVNPGGGTPLRKLLRNTGRYFDKAGNNSDHSALGFTNSSPILSQANGGECQQNFAILMSDGFWNGSSPGVGNEDADGSGNDTQWDGGPHEDNLSSTLADVAMKFYEKDLDTNLPDNVPPTKVNGVVVDPNPAQHLVTYTVSFGLTGSGLTTPADHDPATPPPPWTDPINNSGAQRLDDMQHAAFNGRGLFLNAADPQGLITALNNAFADIEIRTSQSGTSVAINSTVLKTSSRVFQATFNTGDWSGELSSFTLDSQGQIVQPPVWSATSFIPAFDATAVSPNQTTRKIFTLLGNTAIPFDDSSAGLAAAVGNANIVNYIRGDQSNEVQNGGAFRNRSVLLGDIVDSSPISAAADNFFYEIVPAPEGPAYTSYLATKVSTFKDAQGNPFSMVYVGGNDGMLHVFEDSPTDPAVAGREIFAYVPSTLHGVLSDLTDINYTHRFYVDAGPAVADAYLDDGDASTNDWRTMLAGALGSGGKTIYALNVTDPLNFTASDVMWEFNDAELGNVFSQPQIVRLNAKVGNSTVSRYGVIVGNGYNSSSETARLFILDAADGSVIKIIDTQVDGSSNANLPTNGLSMPFLLDEDGDRTVDFAYAGDLQGNIWKFDLRGSNTGQWKSSFKQGNTPKPLYTALDANGNPQPVTTRPVLVNHPDGGFVVLFGTGKFLAIGDNNVPANPQVQTFYGIRDNNATVTAGRTDLQEQQILNDVPVTDASGAVVNTARVVSQNTVDYNTKDGWFIDLLTPPPSSPVAEGERVVANPLTRFDRAIFTTFIPPSSPCAGGGKAVLMEVDAINGGRLENSVFDLNKDNIIDANDFVGYNNTQIPGSGVFIPGTLASPSVLSAADASEEYKLTSGISGKVTTTKESTGGLTVGRQSWRQLR